MTGQRFGCTQQKLRLQPSSSIIIITEELALKLSHIKPESCFRARCAVARPLLGAAEGKCAALEPERENMAGDNRITVKTDVSPVSSADKLLNERREEPCDRLLGVLQLQKQKEVERESDAPIHPSPSSVSTPSS